MIEAMTTPFKGSKCAQYEREVLSNAEKNYPSIKN